MKTRKIFTMAAAAVTAVMFAIAGCSGHGGAKKQGSVEASDSALSIGAMDVEQAWLAKADGWPAIEDGTAGATGYEGGIADMIRIDSVLYAVAGDELIMVDLKTKVEQRIRAAEPLWAVTEHAGKIYVGGTTLYELCDNELEPVPAVFGGAIQTLGSHGYRLMIGTSEGLFAFSIFGDEALFEGISVMALAEDSSGLWVGTDGQGLYRWDGAEFKRRYLYRDTAVFDRINALAFSNNHLFVGTDQAMYVYDGGRWETVTTEQGLPSNEIRSIDASGWVVYVATPAGVVSWFNYDVMPVAKLADLAAMQVRAFGTKLVVATEREGVVLKTGPVVSTLIDGGSIPMVAERQPEAVEPLKPESAESDTVGPKKAEPVATIE